MRHTPLHAVRLALCWTDDMLSALTRAEQSRTAHEILFDLVWAHHCAIRARMYLTLAVAKLEEL